jgi:CheY-like chemotaxis protein
MGLSMVHGIVEDMGGAITVKSSPGRGTTFHILLPLCQGETAKPETTKPLPEKRSGRILYVDDEAGIVASGRVILEELGYEVVATTSAMEALEIFKSRPEAFDLVLTDLTMPKITGIELSQRIMKIRRDIPILLCTGFCSSSDEAKIKKIGIKGMVMKPMTPRELDGAINALLHP